MASETNLSICMPTYNGSAYLAEAIESVLNQSYREFELIIVDDCSTDNTVSKALEYAQKDDRIRVIVNECNLGLVGNWNRCIELANYEWLKFVFQDDVLLPECLQLLINSSPGQMLVVAGRKYIYEDGIEQPTKKDYERLEHELSFGFHFNGEIRLSPERFSKISADLLGVNIWGEPSSVLVNKKVFNKIGVFDNSFHQVCDLEMWLRIGTNFGAGLVNKTLVAFRVHTKSTTMSNLTENFFQSKLLDFFQLANKLLTSPLYLNFRLHTRECPQGIEIEIAKQFRILKRITADQLQIRKDIEKSFPIFKKYYNSPRYFFFKAILSSLFLHPKPLLLRLKVKFKFY